MYGQQKALENGGQFYVVFNLLKEFHFAPTRAFDFMLRGLQDVKKKLDELQIPFILLRGEVAENIPEFVTEKEIGLLICDFSPLRTAKSWVRSISKKLEDCSFHQVDAHNVIPVWIASPKQEYAARTIRTKINKLLPTYLTEFWEPQIQAWPDALPFIPEEIDFDELINSLEDDGIPPIKNIIPGEIAARARLDLFCTSLIKNYGERNNPNRTDSLSGLSPYLHFGHISAQRCILKANTAPKAVKSCADSFIEECLVRRELADNFCHYNKNYDNINCAPDWAKETLEAHRKDARKPTYSYEILEKGKTHDDLWNACQLQMVREGKMHGYMRMYWAKKVLEWTESPEQAFEFLVKLNDTYELDGRDPNGYTGIAWSVCGVHDQGWKERPIFGKIRYMAYDGCKKKFDVPSYVAKYCKKTK